MRYLSRLARIMIALGVTAAPLACTGSSTGDDAGGIDSDGGATLVRADFSLPDVNPTSTTFGDQVSPRDYLEKVSGWYFGHST